MFTTIASQTNSRILADTNGQMVQTGKILEKNSITFNDTSKYRVFMNFNFCMDSENYICTNNSGVTD